MIVNDYKVSKGAKRDETEKLNVETRDRSKFYFY